MRLRILTWNIKQFSDSNVRSPQVFNQIKRVVRPSGTLEPDVFIVLEVQSKGGVVGEPIIGSGERGIRRLIDRFQHDADLANDWRLVPPLRLSRSTKPPGRKQSSSEGIAVLYRSSKLHFTGPDQSYDYQGTAFAGFPQPAVTNGYAGKCEFQSSYGRSLGFPHQRNRRPWLTTFRTTPGGTNFKILAFHAPPELTTQEKAERRKIPAESRECFKGTQELASVREVKGPGTDAERVIVTGDFNCNYADSRFRKAFQKLESAPRAFNIQNTDTATTLKTPSAALVNDYKTQNIFDNFLLRNVALAPGQATRPNAAVIDPVRGHPNGYPEIHALATGTYTPTTIPTQTFRSGANFGLVRRASDHLPVYVDVNL